MGRIVVVAVEHEGSRNSCAEEVEVVARIVEGLLKPEVKCSTVRGIADD